MLGYPDICCHTIVVDRWQHILSVHCLMIVHYWNYSICKVKLRQNLELRLGRVYQLFKINSVFSTADNGCISHMMKLSIASIKVLSPFTIFWQWVTLFKTFSSIGCDYSERLFLSPTTFGSSVYLLQWYYSYSVLTLENQSWQTALSFTGIPSSLAIKILKCFHLWHLSALFCNPMAFYNSAIWMDMRKYQCINKLIDWFSQVWIKCILSLATVYYKSIRITHWYIIAILKLTRITGNIQSKKFIQVPQHRS